MQAIAAIGPLLAGSGQALSTIGTVATIGGGVLGTVAAYKSAQNSKAQLRAQAAQEEENAKQARIDAAVTAQDRDFESIVAMGEQINKQANTGFFVGGKTSTRARRLTAVLARRDRLRIIEDGERKGANADNRAAGARASASTISPLFDAVAYGLKAAGSAISNASLVSPSAQKRVTGAA